ncbi:hypothetical protein C4J81_08875 [Deltaproteobacteria bacterium Smac51]|nr:hypothetical protein C4J81_08875 [Deltaproteobacteria bacterium Smac51]
MKRRRLSELRTRSELRRCGKKKVEADTDLLGFQGACPLARVGSGVGPAWALPQPESRGWNPLVGLLGQVL